MRIQQILSVLGLVALLFILGPARPASAELDCGDMELDHGICVPNASETNQIDATAGEIITNVLNWMLGIVGILSLTMIVYSGVVYITSAGDKERVDSAQKTLTYAIVGLIVSLIAYSIVSTIGSTDLFGA